MLKRMFALVALAIVGVLALAGPAHAAPVITAQKAGPYAINETVKFTVNGCAKDEPFTWELREGSFVWSSKVDTANGNGKADWFATMPSVGGSYTIYASCSGGASLPIVVSVYPLADTGPELVGSSSAFPPGGNGTFTMTGCAPGEEVRFTVYPVGSSTPVGSPIVVKADKDGSATVTVEVPETEGSYVVEGVCVGSGATATFPFQVGALPVSGGDIAGIVRSGVVIVGVGMGIVLVARRRRRPAVAV